MVLRLEHLKTSTEIDSTGDIAFTFNSHPEEMKFTPHGNDTVSLAGQRGTVGNDNIDVVWMTGRLYLDDRINSHEDIRTFPDGSFEEIKKVTTSRGQYSIPALWPPRGDVDTLVRKSFAKFIFAAESVVQTGYSDAHHASIPSEILFRHALQLQNVIVPTSTWPRRDSDVTSM